MKHGSKFYSRGTDVQFRPDISIEIKCKDLKQIKKFSQPQHESAIEWLEKQKEVLTKLINDIKQN